MQYYYGEQNVCRALDEAEFWKNQEAEHTTVIILTTPGLEQQYVDSLHQYELEFRRLHSELVKQIESAIRSKCSFNCDVKMKMLNLIKECIQDSQKFVKFLENLLKNSSAVQNNQSSQIVINHIIRESQYFIGIDQLILN